MPVPQFSGKWPGYYLEGHLGTSAIVLRRRPKIPLPWKSVEDAVTDFNSVEAQGFEVMVGRDIWESQKAEAKCNISPQEANRGRGGRPPYYRHQSDQVWRSSGHRQCHAGIRRVKLVGGSPCFPPGRRAVDLF